MKNALIILTVFCVGLGTVFVMRCRRLDAALQTARSEGASVSNRLAEASAKLLAHESNSLSLQTKLAACSEELHKTSTRLASALADQARAEAEAGTVRDRATRDAARLAALEGERAEFAGTAEELRLSIGRSETQIAETAGELQAAQQARLSLSNEIARLRADKAGLQQQLGDIEALQAQLARLKAAQTEKQRRERVSHKTTGRSRLHGGQQLLTGGEAGPQNSDAMVKLELLPDGSVRLEPAATNDSPAR